ncbi:MAG TPA: phenylalanine--tRNA ligase subunit alpha [Candidatus Tripitaka californicus]|uniref:phenylalanine--tRNA ligase subunit alpha n=1 Tax=Candidatus Tripitaka californicus TaxID=3367616 RepID=UPI004029BBFF
MKEALLELREKALEELKSLRSAEELELFRVKYLGRKGLLSEYMAQLSTLPPDEKRVVGKLANEIKVELTRGLEEACRGVLQYAPAKVSPVIDVSLPGHIPPRGRTHPLVQTIQEIKEIFGRMGFQVVSGPEVELEYFNFEALNIPPDHPSRDDFDTFYVSDDVLLRSQTSTVQIRVMQKQKPPIRIIAPGKVFRPDTVDARHSFMFHQIEGLMVGGSTAGEGVNFGHLKGVLSLFIKTYFGPDTRMRLRPSFFPFTEPSAEVEISCSLCKGKGCSVCGGSGWLEILGAGMVHPNVFKAVGYDPEQYTGFAFGMGGERIAMLKYGIDDIRLFFENDVRFLAQF